MLEISGPNVNSSQNIIDDQCFARYVFKKMGMMNVNSYYILKMSWNQNPNSIFIPIMIRMTPPRIWNLSPT